MGAALRLRRLTSGVVIAVAAGALATPSVAVGAVATHDVRARVLPDARLPLGSRILGATPSAERLHVSVFLEPRSASALAAFAAAVSDVHAAQFRHYLARGQFAARFGPTAAAIHSVESFARRAGIEVASLSSNHLDLSLVGTAGAFASAFSTQLSEVRLLSGASGRAATSPVHLPGAIASTVLAVVGLNDVLHAHTSLARASELRRPTAPDLGRSFPTVRPSAISGAPGACAAATDATQLGFGGITDDQVAHAYGADGLYAAGDLGSGQTIAIFELEPFLKSDLAAFEECYFGADHASQLSVINVDGGPGSGTGGGEAALDVENVAALAPAAKILVYQAPNTSYGSLDAYNRIVSDDRAQVVTSSWGFCETDQLTLSPGSMAAENLLFEQAAAQGQTVFNAGGDAGNDSCAYDSGFPTSPVLSVGDPASQPYVLGVGGTTAISVTQPPTEQVWNDGALGGAGAGGISSVWVQPPWLGAKADALSSASPCHAPTGEVCRTTPDVSAFADEYTGITIYWDGAWTTIGGTSSSSPIWAALLALINASTSCTSVATTARGVGFAAPLLYRVAADPTDYASGFNDVTSGNNDVFGVTKGRYAAKPGYDLASGLGSPELTAATGVTGPGLAASLCAAAQIATTAQVASISPKRGSAKGATSFTITGTGFRTGTASDVTQVDFGTSPAAHFTVVSSTEITGTTSSASTPTTSSRLNSVVSHSGGVLVSVTTSNGEVAVGPTFHYVVESSSKTVPTVIEVGPTGGPASGGNTVELYGTGFTGAKKVSFGGEPAISFKVLSDVQIAAIAPKLAKASCLAASALASIGVCQTQVQVTGPGGASPTVAAKVPFSGFLSFNQLGVITVPKHCGCEAYPTITEYDYVTAASLTKLTDEAGKTEVGDPDGSGEVVLHGTGFNVLTLNWVDFGSTTAAASEDVNLLEVNATGTKLEVLTLADPSPGPDGESVPVSVQTLAGPTDAKSFTYAPVPVVTALSDEVLPSAGGTTLTISGGGFLGTQQVVFSPFDGNDPPVIILKNYTVRSATSITMPVPSMVPTAYQVFVCNEYTCGTGNPMHPTSATLQVIYPGATAVTSAEASPSGAQPITGPTTGGTRFEVQGTNFGPLGSVSVLLVNALGEKVQATRLVAGPTATDAGATETILATAPPSLGGNDEACAVVLVGEDGTSAETASALFGYI
jgi:Pro-kumamolisin, activation domain/IPT/TIG domain